MFVQVIEGPVHDRNLLHRQLEEWNTRVRPGAVGFLGATAGVTADGDGILLARFASEATAQANSDRPEQGVWWATTQGAFSGKVSFRNSADTEAMFDFGTACDNAGFVQVMQATVTDRVRLAALEDASLDALKAMRPALIGALRAWDGDQFTQAVYFTNEADARRDEATGVPDAVAGAFVEWQKLCRDARFFDLTEPWLF